MRSAFFNLWGEIQFHSRLLLSVGLQMCGPADGPWGHPALSGLPGGPAAGCRVPGEGLRGRRPPEGPRWHDLPACCCSHGPPGCGAVAGQWRELVLLWRIKVLLTRVDPHHSLHRWAALPSVCPARTGTEPLLCTSLPAEGTVASWRGCFTWVQRSSRITGEGPHFMMRQKMESWRLGAHFLFRFPFLLL